MTCTLHRRHRRTILAHVCGDACHHHRHSCCIVMGTGAHNTCRRSSTCSRHRSHRTRGLPALHSTAISSRSDARYSQGARSCRGSTAARAPKVLYSTPSTPAYNCKSASSCNCPSGAPLHSSPLSPAPHQAPTAEVRHNITTPLRNASSCSHRGGRFAPSGGALAGWLAGCMVCTARSIARLRVACSWPSSCVARVAIGYASRCSVHGPCRVSAPASHARRGTPD